jgi:NTP pyrophosphatase (non-canonical NTP hydrolase)
MTLNGYQTWAAGTALPTALSKEYLSLGLVGEAGEVASLFAKAVRDSDGVVDREKLMKELGDVQWFVAVLSYKYGISLLDLVEANVKKIESRKERGVLGGSGDNR